MAKFRKKPVVIDAICWQGGDFEILNAFCGKNWGRADSVGLEAWPSGVEDTEQVVVFNTTEKAWLPVPVGWWVIRGIEGELYPCDQGIFRRTYELVEDSQP